MRLSLHPIQLGHIGSNELQTDGTRNMMLVNSGVLVDRVMPNCRQWLLTFLENAFEVRVDHERAQHLISEVFEF